MESDTMILLLITISLIVVVVYNQFINCDKEEVKRRYRNENFRNINNSKRVSVMTDSLGDNTINKKDLYKYNKIYRKNICLDNKNNKNKKKYKEKIEIIENDIDSLDNLLNNDDMKSLNNIDNNTLSDIETFVK
jgi:hypothetical protein